MTAVAMIGPERRARLRQTLVDGARTAGRRATKAIAASILPPSVVVWRGDDARRYVDGPTRVALTFDDGPTSLTSEYLDVLARFGARATFFVVGELCARRPDAVTRMADAGHELAGHGYTHRRFTALSTRELESELWLTAALLPPSRRARPLVRPPYGSVNGRSLLTCARAGFTTVLWSYDSGDSRTVHASDVMGAFGVAEASEPGGIVLLHDGHGWTLEALPSILGELRKAGHELVTVGEILDG